MTDPRGPVLQIITRDRLIFRGQLLDLGDIRQWLRWESRAIVAAHDGSAALHYLESVLNDALAGREYDLCLHRLRGTLFRLNRLGYKLPEHLLEAVSAAEIEDYVASCFPGSERESFDEYWYVWKGDTRLRHADVRAYRQDPRACYLRYLNGQLQSTTASPERPEARDGNCRIFDSEAAARAYLRSFEEGAVPTG